MASARVANYSSKYSTWIPPESSYNDQQQQQSRRHPNPPSQTNAQPSSLFPSSQQHNNTALPSSDARTGREYTRRQRLFDEHFERWANVTTKHEREFHSRRFSSQAVFDVEWAKFKETMAKLFDAAERELSEITNALSEQSSSQGSEDDSAEDDDEDDDHDTHDRRHDTLAESIPFHEDVYPRWGIQGFETLSLGLSSEDDSAGEDRHGSVSSFHSSDASSSTASEASSVTSSRVAPRPGTPPPTEIDEDHRATSRRLNRQKWKAELTASKAADRINVPPSSNRINVKSIFPQVQQSPDTPTEPSPVYGSNPMRLEPSGRSNPGPSSGTRARSRARTIVQEDPVLRNQRAEWLRSHQEARREYELRQSEARERHRQIEVEQQAKLLRDAATRGRTSSIGKDSAYAGAHPRSPPVPGNANSPFPSAPQTPSPPTSRMNPSTLPPSPSKLPPLHSRPSNPVLMAQNGSPSPSKPSAIDPAIRQRVLSNTPNHYRPHSPDSSSGTDEADEETESDYPPFINLPRSSPTAPISIPSRGTPTASKRSSPPNIHAVGSPPSPTTPRQAGMVDNVRRMGSTTFSIASTATGMTSARSSGAWTTASGTSSVTSLTPSLPGSRRASIGKDAAIPPQNLNEAMLRKSSNISMSSSPNNHWRPTAAVPSGTNSISNGSVGSVNKPPSMSRASTLPSQSPTASTQIQAQGSNNSASTRANVLHRQTTMPPPTSPGPNQANFPSLSRSATMTPLNSTSTEGSTRNAPVPNHSRRPLPSVWQNDTIEEPESENVRQNAQSLRGASSVSSFNSAIAAAQSGTPPSKGQAPLNNHAKWPHLQNQQVDVDISTLTEHVNSTQDQASTSPTRKHRKKKGSKDFRNQQADDSAQTQSKQGENRAREERHVDEEQRLKEEQRIRDERMEQLAKEEQRARDRQRELERELKEEKQREQRMRQEREAIEEEQAKVEQRLKEERLAAQKEREKAEAEQRRLLVQQREEEKRREEQRKEEQQRKDEQRRREEEKREEKRKEEKRREDRRKEEQRRAEEQRRGEPRRAEEQRTSSQDDQRAREERIRMENARLTEQFRARERVGQMSSNLPQRIAETWLWYEESWKRMQSQLPNATQSLSFATIPWPVLNPPDTPAAITKNAIGAFVLSQWHSGTKTRKDRIREALLRWHPDRFGRWLDKVPEGDERERVKEAVGNVARTLNELMAQEGSFAS